MTRPTAEQPQELREATTAPVVDISGIRNVTDLLAARAAAAPEHIAFERRRDGAPLAEPWEQISTSAFLTAVTDAARGLIAAGITPGDTVLIMAETQYLWAVADQAALFAGAIVVPVYDTAAEPQLRGIIADALPTAAFAGTPEIAARIAAAASAVDVAAPQTWSLVGPAAGSLTALTALGTNVTDAELTERRLTANLDDVATIVYTSGTTGSPKGALITHRNLVGQVLNIAAEYTEVLKESGNTILFLPLTHVLGRALQLICIANGMRIAHLANPKEVVQALAVLRPTFLVVVPRVLEKIQAAAAASAHEKRLDRVWAGAVRTAEAWGALSEARDHNPELRASLGLRVRHALFDRVFYSRLRAVMGGRIEYLLSGAATLHPDLSRFFRGIGVPIIEGYGLTETTAPLTGGRPGSVVAGSVGPPMPGNTVRIAADGEVLARGVGVFAGYRDAAQNAQVFVDGFFRTGDIGSLAADGSLTLHGRLKHVIVTSTGRTVTPEPWEQSVETHPLIAHAALVGTDLPFLTAVIVVDHEAAPAWFAARGDTLPHELARPGLTVSEDERIAAALGEAIATANAGVSPAERVRSWVAVSVGADRAHEFITPTQKLKRQPLIEALDAELGALYT